MTFLHFQSDPTLVLNCIKRVWVCGHLVLCLSASPDNLLMWAHYAKSHEGFVLGFDAESGFLKCPENNHWPQRVVYQETRPVVKISKTNFDPTGAYFTKSKHWEYEDEYRVIRKPDGLQSSGVDANEFPTYLFDMPSDVIKEIILGYRIKSELKSEIERIKKEKFPRAVLKNASLSKDEFKVII